MDRVIFAPRSYQREAQEARRAGCKRFVNVWHRRGGKDKTWLGITLEESQKRVGYYFHVFPSLNQGRRDLWDNIGSDGIPFMKMFPDELIAANGRNELEMQVTFKNGSIWQIMGADDLKSIARLRGPNPIGIVYSEYGNMRIEAWETLSPVLAENGGWAAFIYTPPDVLPICCVTGDANQNRCRGNHAKKLYEMAKEDPKWHCSFKTVEDTRRDGVGESGEHVITPEAIAEERKDKSEHMIQREYYCQFDTPVEGSYYGDLIRAAERNGRIREVPYDEALPVHLACDLGSKKITMAFGAFQISGPDIRWINCWSEVGRGLPAYAHAIRENNLYIFGRSFMPHDANAHEIGTGKTRVETWRSLGFRDITIVQKLGPADGIETTKRMIPKMWFDHRNCQPMLYALKHYHEENGAPKHDDTSHFADMVRTACVGLKEPKPRITPVQSVANTSRDVFGRGPLGQKYATSRTQEHWNGR